MLDKLVFLDIETTGIDPQKDLILEVGVVYMDPDTLEETGSASVVFDHVWREVETLTPKKVWRMHQDSGLLVDVVNSSIAPDTLEAWVKANVHRGSILAGFSVHFDREFLLAKAPSLREWFHHRLMDVSTLRECAKVWRPELVTKQKVDHRAIADSRAALQEFRTYGIQVFGRTP